ncbi:tRNA (adenine(58)-N(1))-methyltransferase non-catalytic subunit TRM6 [Ceratina calcarata]|uniref:tRNA (adenine(58)-N(1))-methyltransferase non-catalytic subunit TRM6 n=1 Tax=Ceratina calcarata TaxID=156304 RepID=A0AAJ7ITH4_9HYME|nr:tRNA (adenine(58)-N(1))-methyltransferase non-catalytic subunit TRM6 [Ceratina calcarata]
MCEIEEDTIAVGMYVIIKKLNFKKIYKVTANGSLMLGKDLVEMSAIIGKRFWSTFEMIPTKEGKRAYSLKEVLEAESLNDLLNELPSGSDNRTIIDDGTSQKLSKEEILQLQESGKTGKEIVGSLIENNKSFLDRTEYSQEKYLKKKEQKYLRYLTVCRPNISSLHDVYFKLDLNKIGGLRMDSLAQLLSYSDVQSDGLHILYDSGSQGLPAAAMLNRIGSNTNGHLINLHPGNVPQAMLVNAMNFPKEQTDRLVNVNIYSFLRLYYQGENAVWNNISNKDHSNWINKVKESKRKKEEEDLIEKPQTEEISSNVVINESEKVLNDEVNEEQKTDSGLKRKFDGGNESSDSTPAKKPRWLLDTQRAVELVQGSKARGLTIVCKEHPLNIVTALLPFLGASRPFVIYHAYREPLQEVYVALKQTQNVINLRLFSNFLRSYQILPDRTHPDILTNDTGGYLLTGYLVEQ